MYFPLIYQIISIILLTGFNQLVQGGNNYLQSKNVNHHLSTMINDKDKERQNGSFSIIVRMMAVGIKRIDEKNSDEQQDLDNNIDWPIAYNRKSLLSGTDNSDEEQTADVQQDTRLLLLPIMIKMLLERLGQRADVTPQLTDLQKFSEINNTVKFLSNKETSFYKSIQGFINITKMEKTTIIIFLILSFVILLFTIYSIIHHLRGSDKFNTIQVSSSSINSKQISEETKKLLP